MDMTSGPTSCGTLAPRESKVSERKFRRHLALPRSTNASETLIGPVPF